MVPATRKQEVPKFERLEFDLLLFEGPGETKSAQNHKHCRNVFGLNYKMMIGVVGLAAFGF